MLVGCVAQIGVMEKDRKRKVGGGGDDDDGKYLLKIIIT